jgi:hypothetical protein
VTAAVRGALVAAAVAGCGGAAHPAPARCPRGDVAISSQDSVEALRGCPALAGDLRIRTGAALDLAALGSLERIRGDLVIGPTLGLDTIAGLGALREVGGTLRLVANGDVTAAFFPALTRAGSVDIDSNLALAQIMFPALTEVGADLLVRRNSMLELVDLGPLTRVGATLALEHNPALASVWVAAPRAAAVRILGNPQLEAATQARLIEGAMAPAAAP